MTPPLAPPKGMLTTAHFQVIQAARARTSSRVTFLSNRMPPLPGPRAMLWRTRYPMNTSMRPSSMAIGIETFVSRTGSRRTL